MHLAQAPCEASILISISSLCVVNLCLGSFKPVLAPLPNLCMVLAASQKGASRMLTTVNVHRMRVCRYNGLAAHPECMTYE